MERVKGRNIVTDRQTDWTLSISHFQSHTLCGTLKLSLNGMEIQKVQGISDVNWVLSYFYLADSAVIFWPLT